MQPINLSGVIITFWLDGCSLSIILKEVFMIHEAFCHGQPINLEQTATYHNYIAWLQQQDIAKAEIFWKEQLKDFTTTTPIRLGKFPIHF